MKDSDLEKIVGPYKEKTMVYKKEAIERLRNILTKTGYEIIAEGEGILFFDCQIPSGHIEFSVEITGWGHEVGKKDKEAGA